LPAAAPLRLLLLCRSAADVNALLAGVQYSGLTPLATSLANKVLGPIVFNLAASGQLAKPVLVLTITDGEPTDNPRDLVVQVRGAAVCSWCTACVYIQLHDEGLPHGIALPCAVVAFGFLQVCAAALVLPQQR
jgi:hypothetical protein